MKKVFITAALATGILAVTGCGQQIALQEKGNISPPPAIEVPQEMKEAAQMAKKIEPFLVNTNVGTLNLKPEAYKNLSKEEVDFALKSIGQTNIFLKEGVWKLGAKPTDFLIDTSKASGSVSKQGLNYWSYDGWESGCGPMYSYTYRNWWAQYVYMDHCNVVQLLRLTSENNMGDFFNLITTMMGPFGVLWWGYRMWFRSADKGNGIYTAQPWAMPILYIYSR